MNMKYLIILICLFISTAAFATGTPAHVRHTKCDFAIMKLVTFKEDVKDENQVLVVGANKSYLAAGLSRYFYEVESTNFVGWTSKKTTLKTFVVVSDMGGRSREVSTHYLSLDSLALLKMSTCE